MVAIAGLSLTLDPMGKMFQNASSLKPPLNRNESGKFGALKSDSTHPTISLEMPVPSQGHYGFHSFPVVD